MFVMALLGAYMIEEALEWEVSDEEDEDEGWDDGIWEAEMEKSLIDRKVIRIDVP